MILVQFIQEANKSSSRTNCLQQKKIQKNKQNRLPYWFFILFVKMNRSTKDPPIDT